MKWGKRNPISRRFHAKDDKGTIASWKLDLDEVLQVFNAYSVANTNPIATGAQNTAVNTPTVFPNIHLNALKSSEDTRGQDLRVSTTRSLPAAE